MNSSLKERILEDMKAAMRSQEKDRLSTIRLITSAIKQKEVDERITLTDEDVMAILNKMIKQRRDSITQFQAGNREDLAKREADEITVIQEYLPKQMSEVEIEHAVADAITEAGATSAKEMGKVMGILKSRLQGKADMTVVSAKVKVRLTPVS